MRRWLISGLVATALPVLCGGCAQTVEVQTYVLNADVTAPPRDVPASRDDLGIAGCRDNLPSGFVRDGGCTAEMWADRRRRAARTSTR